MRRIRYAGEELETGDDIAAALIEYAAALARRGTAAAVEVPTLEADGTRSNAVLLLGPSSHILSRPSFTGHDEIVNEQLVQTLVALTRRLEPPPHHYEPGGYDVLSWTDDF